MRSGYLWALSFVLVAFAAVYQRMTGPTYPVRGSVNIAADEVRYSLPTSHPGESDAEIRLMVSDSTVQGSLELRRFRSDDEWSSRELERQGDSLVGVIPHQPPAGKVMYRIFLDRGGERIPLTSEPVIIRFRGDVPAAVMLPHIVLMFLAMLFSTRAGFEALFKRQQVAKLTLWTIVTLGLGGMMLGPVIQKYAFGAFWTGWPWGHDLTDNKTVVAFLLWLLALWRTRRSPDARGWVLAASVVLFVIYMIPHSVLGSELDYTQMPPPDAGS